MGLGDVGVIKVIKKVTCFGVGQRAHARTRRPGTRQTFDLLLSELGDKKRKWDCDPTCCCGRCPPARRWRRAGRPDRRGSCLQRKSPGPVCPPPAPTSQQLQGNANTVFSGFFLIPFVFKESRFMRKIKKDFVHQQKRLFSLMFQVLPVKILSSNMLEGKHRGR